MSLLLTPKDPRFAATSRAKMKSRAVWQIFFLLVSVGYMFIWVMLPTKTYELSWSLKLKKRLDSTYFREQGRCLELMYIQLRLNIFDTFFTSLPCLYMQGPILLYLVFLLCSLLFWDVFIYISICNQILRGRYGLSGLLLSPKHTKYIK